MSHTAHIPSHRKPRLSTAKNVLRAGVAGGVLSTIAVAGAAGSANAAEPVTETTIQMPTLSAAQVAEATEQAATDLQQQAQQDTAAQDAAKAAKKAKTDAVHKAEAKKKAEAKAKAEAEAKKKAEAAALQRASRSSARTTLNAVPASSVSNIGGSSSSSSSQATGSAASIVSFVKSHIGDAYVMGGTGSSSWDCSGLVQAAYKNIGVDLPRVSQGQSTAGTQVSLSNLQPGDILYWGSAGSAYHVAIYVGGGQFVGAQNPSSGVVERPLSYDQPTGAVRVL
ncbi:C40 family peptidase [Streptomyces sp. A 4/2]|uniref:C40 family peptidase n=1 Tax=Streptomyces sp. A 4/2 TaxID=2934314 RepID=UPI0020254606|nr:C40 family peptidase [Streptomyces sp. A 4/2]